jgi:CRISPR-associated protein Cmr1
MRKHNGSPPKVTPKQLEEVITQVREYQLITPLYGGGVAPAEADPITVIRGSEIRGHLRFWWRACRNGKPEFDGDHTRLKKAEDEIWGKAYGKDDEPVPQYKTVQIEVKVDNPGTLTKLFTIENKRGKNQPKSLYGPGIGYVAFPLQPSQEELKRPNPDVKDVRTDVAFTLTISFPVEQKDEIEAALWAWETFGGIGARTRRGFGALHLLRVNGEDNTDLPPPDVQQAAVWLKRKRNQLIVNGKYPPGMPHLSPSAHIRITSLSQNGFEAWRTLAKKLHSFRQIPDGRSGRSYWPEAEAIREITGKRDDKYPKLPHPKKFPRAAFGLPIIFHFREADADDPDDTTLQGAKEGKERLASPLILRPLACKGGKAVGIAVLLQGTQVIASDLQLVHKETKKPYSDAIETELTQTEADNIGVLAGETDVLKAFMSYLRGVEL